MSESENKVVLFADMLGFASLTESHPLDADRLRAHNRLISYIERYLGAPKNPLVDSFSRFHSAVASATSIANMRHPLTAITFSDSAFVATTYLHEAVSIAADLIRSVTSSGVPVRAGIAYGSFAALRFKSDITSEGGDHAVQFLGTAVVRAVAAEKCGIKGIRILLHPSLMPLLEDSRHNPAGVEKEAPATTIDGLVNSIFRTSANIKNPIRILKCPEKELGNRADVQHEIDYWDLPITREASTWKGLQEMWDRAPTSETNHYEATAEAINRMRIGRGRAPLDKLRRRTLPR